MSSEVDKALRRAALMAVASTCIGSASTRRRCGASRIWHVAGGVATGVAPRCSLELFTTAFLLGFAAHDMYELIARLVFAILACRRRWRSRCSWRFIKECSAQNLRGRGRQICSSGTEIGWTARCSGPSAPALGGKSSDSSGASSTWSLAASAPCPCEALGVRMFLQGQRNAGVTTAATPERERRRRPRALGAQHAYGLVRMRSP